MWENTIFIARLFAPSTVLSLFTWPWLSPLWAATTTCDTRCLRSCAALLPLCLRQMRTPLVELPLGATEDRICGTIDIEKALSGEL